MHRFNPARKYGLAVLVMAALAAFIAFDPAPEPRPNKFGTTINSIIGDESFVAAFGRAPTPADDEDLRIRTHLAYVEELLREADVRHLPAHLQVTRSIHLDRLRAYREAGNFPRNGHAFEARRPNFIDAEGRICAVGYLIEQSAGRELAEAINAQYQFDYLPDMNDAALAAWVETSGFTVTELAMIQPGYGWCNMRGDCPDPEAATDPVPRVVEYTGLGFSSVAAVTNSLLAAYDRPGYFSAGAGIAIGGATMALGLSNRSRHTEADIIAGSLAMLMGGFNLWRAIDRDRVRASGPEMYLDVSPTPDHGHAVGMNMRLRF